MKFSLLQDSAIKQFSTRSLITRFKYLFQFSRRGSVIADVDLIYYDVFYQDILLLEEALHINMSFDGLSVSGITMNSSSGEWKLLVSALWRMVV